MRNALAIPIIAVSLVLFIHESKALCSEPSCDSPLENKYNLSKWEVNQRCMVIREEEYESLSDLDCEEYQYVYSQCYWCAETEHEEWCVNYIPCPSQSPTTETNITAACEDLSTLYELDGEPWSTEFCTLYEDASFQCPYFCYDWYLGADTEAQRIGLVWIARVSGILSVIGATFIMFDILKEKKKRITVLNQLLVGMAVFDICSGVAWAFSTAPIPSNHVHGSVGNESSCTAQGFFIQLGFTSVFYNVSLSLRYYLTIARTWRESDMKRIRVYLHAVPLIIGFGLAFGGIPKYTWIEYSCHLLTPPEVPLWETLVFVAIPLCISILLITVFMLLMYNKVRVLAQASRKWKFGIGTSSSMERQVFWQCFWYVVAFYVTWPLVLAVYVASVDVNGPYAIAVFYAMLAPIQGFSNFLVYMLRTRKPRGRTSGTSTSSPDDSGNTSNFRTFFSQFGTKTTVKESVIDESEVVDDAEPNFA